MRLATNAEWDDMEHRVEFPDAELGYPNELAIIMAQEVFDIVLYVWERTSQRRYEVLLAPSSYTAVVNPQFVGHLLHYRDPPHYDLLLPRWEFIADDFGNITHSGSADQHGVAM
jgi:hypothetical protein